MFISFVCLSILLFANLFFCLRLYSFVCVEEIHDGLRIGEIVRGLMDTRARASTARSMPRVWCVLRVVRDGALRDSTAVRGEGAAAAVAVSGRRGARALPSASWVETSSVEVQTLRVTIECGRAQVVLVDDYGGVDLPLVRLRVDESRHREPALRLRVARLVHKWTRRDEAPGAAGNSDVSATVGGGAFGVHDVDATVNVRIAMDYFEHAAVDDTAAATRSGGGGARGDDGTRGEADAPSAAASSSAISFVDNASSSGPLLVSFVCFFCFVC